MNSLVCRVNKANSKELWSSEFKKKANFKERAKENKQEIETIHNYYMTLKAKLEILKINSVAAEKNKKI